MQRKYSERKHITVYLDAEEYQQIEEAAGGQGRISSWAREALLQRLPGIGNVSRRDAKDVERRSQGACPHRKERGELCYKCDPKFGNPKVEEG